MRCSGVSPQENQPSTTLAARYDCDIPVMPSRTRSPLRQSLVALSLASASPAGAHRSGCHSHHTCPSDHATYYWRGWLCVKPTADERTSRFRHRIRYRGYTYYCHR
jgi:hypothetical protein